MRHQNRHTAETIVWGTLRIILVGVLLVIVVFPILWLFIGAVKPEKQILAYPPTLFASSYTIASFERIFNTIPMGIYLKNTVIFAFGVTLTALLFDSLAGYAFARFNFRGKHAIFLFVIITMMIPFQVIMIPLFMESYLLGLLNTYAGLILPRMTTAFGIFMMRSFFSQLPVDLEEASRIDGLGEFGIFFRIMLPLVLPGLLTLGIFHFMNSWNDLLYPLMMTSSVKMRTLSAGLALFVGERATLYYGPQMAGAVISVAPLLIMYMLFQRYFVASVASTGLKE